MNTCFLNENLSNSALRVFLVIIKNLNQNNIFYHTSELVNYFELKEILSKSSVYRGLKELEEKHIICKISDEEKEKLGIYANNAYKINIKAI